MCVHTILELESLSQVEMSNGIVGLVRLRTSSFSRCCCGRCNRLLLLLGGGAQVAADHLLLDDVHFVFVYVCCWYSIILSEIELMIGWLFRLVDG